MLKRIVKMSFKPEAVATFVDLFKTVEPNIKSFPGCEYLQLYFNMSKTNVIFTISYWKDTESLEKYRHSDLFEKTWLQTKKLFNEKPEAWSLEEFDFEIN